MSPIRQKVLIFILAPLLFMSVGITAFAIVSINRNLAELSLVELIRESENKAQELELLLSEFQFVMDTFAISAAHLFEEQDFAREGDAYLTDYRDKLAPMVEAISRSVENCKGTYFMFAPDYGSRPSQVWFYESGGDFSRIFEYPDKEQFDREDPNMLYYYRPIDKGVSFWSPPYFDNDTGDLMLSYTVPVVVESSTIGIVGMDLTIRFIEKMISEIRFRERGYAFLLNSQFESIYHPLFPFKMHLDEMTGEDLAFVSRVIQSDKVSDTAIYDFRGEKKRLGYTRMKNGWTLCVTAFEEELFEPAAKTRNNLILISIFIQIIVGSIGYMTARFISRPIDTLTSEVKQSVFDMNSTISNPALLARKDELGNLSRQFRELQLVFQNTIKKLIDNNISMERLALLGDQVGGFTHELKTPIGVVLTSLSFAEDQIKELEKKVDSGISRKELDHLISKTKEGIALAMRNLNQASSLIGNFKSLAVSQSVLTVETVSLREIVEHVRDSLTIGKKYEDLEFHISIPGNMFLESCEGYLTQVFTNLIQNSLKHGFFNRENGAVAIEAEKLSDKILIRYGDNGNGIPEEKTGEIFKPYYTSARDRGGTGLGLHIVRTIIEEHLKGTIEYDSRSNPGAHFRIKLPIKMTG